MNKQSPAFRPLSPINYNSPSELRVFLEQNGLGMRKKFGQNFLINPSVRQALIEALCASGGASGGANEGDEVWEIGPGLGAMTAVLLGKGLKVKTFEIDEGFIRVLKMMFNDQPNFLLIEGDVMKSWKQQDAHSGGGDAGAAEDGSIKKAGYLLGNLPYNIAASLLADFIENGKIFSRMVVTVQKEVAIRMAAKPGSADYSSFSVLCASVYNIKPLLTIKPSSFYPKPNVDSMGVLLEAKTLTEPYPKIFYPLVRTLFSSRRKTIKNNLLKFSVPPCRCVRILSDNNLTGNERAETLELDQFVSLAKSIESMR